MDQLDRVTTAAFLDALGGSTTGHGPHVIGARRIVAAHLLLRIGQIVSCDELGEVLYGAREEGGPLWARQVIRAEIFHLRRLGWSIQSSGHQGWLVKIDKNLAIPKTAHHGRPFKYDWSLEMRSLEVGDSFFEPAANPKDAQLMRAGMGNRARSLGFKIATRALTENKARGVRCWRLA